MKDWQEKNVDEVRAYVRDYAGFLADEKTAPLGMFSLEHAIKSAAFVNLWAEDDADNWVGDNLGEEFFESHPDFDLADLIHVDMLRHGGVQTRGLLSKALDGLIYWWRKDDRPDWMSDDYMRSQKNGIVFCIGATK